MKFHAISDTKFKFIDVELRNEFQKLILKAGRKKIVFVECYDDKAIFDVQYESDLDKLDFIDTSMEGAKRKEKISRSCKAARGGVRQLRIC
ncbi:hypothetical protein QUF72_11925 [Desulfobacterales bacterium HSG2]|nr:hypothetical protein [Desulfobacterales bacterium HSG2]